LSAWDLTCACGLARPLNADGPRLSPLGLDLSFSLFHCSPETTMFTGIITGIGRIVALQDLGASQQHGKRLTIEAPAGYLDDVGLGDSIALNGACMTVTSLQLAQRQFTIDISAESLDKTSGLTHTGPVNLEKALRANDRLGGHIVSGHVDGLGTVASFGQVGESWELCVTAPRALGLQRFDHLERGEPDRQSGHRYRSRHGHQHQPDPSHGRKHHPAIPQNRGRNQPGN
jgi:hypothetical protein